MEEIKCIHDIKNGDLVVTRDKRSYIKIDKYLVGTEGWLSISNYQINDDLISDERILSRFDIIEIWSPVDVLEFLSFDLGDRELVWKEQEQKYYMMHKWLKHNNYNFLNWNRKNKLMELQCTPCTNTYQTQFTSQEIEKIKEKYNTTLEDFEFIPVKEI